MKTGILLKILKYSGLSAIAVFISSVIVSVNFNPWFSLFENAFSDLGGSKANMPYIFNYGLICFGFLTLLFSAYSIYISSNKVETAAGGFMAIASIYFMLIGFFPYNPSSFLLHGFVAISSFIIGYISITVWGLGSLLSRSNRRLGLYLLILSTLSPFIIYFLSSLSDALVESYGILVLAAWVIQITFFYKK